MGDGYEIIDILLFAAIAGFLLLRLRSVLGRRTGNERPPPRPPVLPKVLPAPPKISPAPFRVVTGAAAPAQAIGIAAIKAADPAFAEDNFLRGARGAFEIIVDGFAAGDTAVLQPLLSKDVFDRFAEAIRERGPAQKKLPAKLVAIKAADIADAVIEGNTALVTVKFVSDQADDAAGSADGARPGAPGHPIEHIDLWTFARPLRSRDPNWTLAATHSP